MKWTKKYKKSINCKKTKGFSQKQYCKTKRKEFLQRQYKTKRTGGLFTWLRNRSRTTATPAPVPAPAFSPLFIQKIISST